MFTKQILKILCVISIMTSVHASVSVTTNVGNGGETYMCNDSSQDLGRVRNDGGDSSTDVRWDAAPRLKVTALRFDLSGIDTNSVSNVQLQFHINWAHRDNRNIEFYGLIDSAAPADDAGGSFTNTSATIWNDYWVEDDYYNGLMRDTWGKIGISGGTDDGTYVLDSRWSTKLGTSNIQSAVLGDGIFITDLAEVDFDSLVQNDLNGYITILVVGEAGTSGNHFTITTKEGTTDTALMPTLIMYAGALTHAHFPNPDDKDDSVGAANGTTVQATLSWLTGMDPCDMNNFDPNITNHLLYLDTDSEKLGYGLGALKEANIPESGPDFNASTTFTDLDYGETYYWRVNEIIKNAPPDTTDPNKIRIGYIWEFTTISEDPCILTQPSDALADVNEVVQFSVDIYSATTPDLKWYKSTDADPNVNLDTHLSNYDDSNTLTVIANEANDAYYYVVVGNASTTEVTSDVVHLWLKREIARYMLDNDLTDSSAAGKGGTAEWDAAGDFNDPGADFDPCAVEGSSSVKFYADVNAFISVPGSEDYFNHYVYGLTVSCWVRDSTGSGNEALVSKHACSTTGSIDFDDGTWKGWTLQLTAGEPLFEIRHSDVYLNGPSIADDDWHMITVTYDSYEPKAKMYIDGALDSNDVDITPGTVQKTPLDVLAIATVDANDGSNKINPYDGFIDDVRIWTYPLNGTEIAALYMDDYGDYHGKGSICVDNAHPIYDYDDDCDTDIADFAMFIETWLDCNLYPASECGN